VAALRDYGGPNAFAIPGNHGECTAMGVAVLSGECGELPVVLFAAVMDYGGPNAFATPDNHSESRVRLL
jgi:hypothetical protein